MQLEQRSASRDLQWELEQFYYLEARLLDDGRFDEWLALFTEDATYVMPNRESRQGDRDGIPPEDEPSLTIFHDDKQFLTLRVKRLHTGLAHSERPPSRTRRLVTNVEVEEGSGGELAVRSNFLVFQARLEGVDTPGYFFLGKRQDRVRHEEGRWRVASRRIILDQALLPRTLSIFF